MIASLFLSLMCASLMDIVRSEELTFCPEEFCTAESSVDQVHSICTVQNGKIDSDQSKSVEVNANEKVLIVSPFYGCGNYTDAEFKCQLDVSTADPNTLRRLRMTLVESSLYRTSYCNLNSDQLIFDGVVQGENSNRRLTICGKRTDLSISSTAATATIIFRTSAGTTDKGFELLIETSQTCTESDERNAIRTNTASSAFTIYKLCEMSEPMTITSETSALFTSDDYGCHNYSRLSEGQDCSIELSAESGKQLVYTVTFMDLRQGSSPCDFKSDRLVFTNVEGGNPERKFSKRLCGTKKSVEIRVKEGMTSRFSFKQGKVMTKETSGAGFEVLVEAK